MLALTFRIRRPGTIGSVTVGRTGAILHTWCNLETDFVHVVSHDEDETAKTVAALLQRFGSGAVQASAGERPGNAVLVPCPANRSTSVSATVERHGGLVQPPIVSADGWDTFRTVLFDDTKAPALLRAIGKLGQLELVSKKRLQHLASKGFFVPSSELVDGLTRRQAEAILAAASRGYYEEPRSTTLASLAADAGIGRASLEEHLRKAENKVMKALVPLVAARVGSLRPTKKRGAPFPGNSRRKAQGGNATATTRADDHA